jgi:hypothetical protein
VPTQQTAVPAPHVTAGAPAAPPPAPVTAPPPPSMAAHGDTRGTVPSVPAATAKSTGRKLSPLALVAGIILLVGAAGGAWYVMQPNAGADSQTLLSGTGTPDASPTSALPPNTPPKTPETVEGPSTPAGGGEAASSGARGAASAASSVRETAANAPAEVRKPEPTANTPSGSKASPKPSAPAPPVAPAPPPVLPDNPAVFVSCEGPREVCGALRAAFDQSLPNERLPIARSSDGADVLVQLEVTELDRRVDQQFGQTMVTRSYSVAMVGDAPKVDRVVPLPSTQNFSFDAKYAERLNQEARKIAIAAVGRIRQFAEAK